MKARSTEAGKKVQFTLSSEPGDLVYVSGTFNQWNPTAHQLKSDPDCGQFRTTVRMPGGTHEYKFVVNGVWTADPKCAAWVPNCHGTINSVVQV